MSLLKKPSIFVISLMGIGTFFTNEGSGDEHLEERYRVIEELVLDAVRDHQIEPRDASDLLGHLRELFAESEHAEEEWEYRGYGSRWNDKHDDHDDHDDHNDLGEHERKLKHAHREILEAIESGRISLEEGREKMETLEREMLGMHVNFKREEFLNWIRDAERSGEISKEEARQKREEFEKEFSEDRERWEREELARKEQETPRRGSADREEAETRERSEGDKERPD